MTLLAFVLVYIQYYIPLSGVEDFVASDYELRRLPLLLFLPVFGLVLMLWRRSRSAWLLLVVICIAYIIFGVIAHGYAQFIGNNLKTIVIANRHIQPWILSYLVLFGFHLVTLLLPGTRQYVSNTSDP